ncbi:unnamed protein product [Clonostachys rhizophaga]|uniref:Uncharacterized protein n=1 Tax=Clonostachys rhizophaga TaxID=160324 RepID=A0A9N9W235_9HYPO|nr:unnamed protein product [Clonostachys rhizophaga]
MSIEREEFDPQGDTLIVIPEKSVTVGQLGWLQSAAESQPEYHFLCSKKHLSTASRRAHKVLSGGFKESIPDESDGLHHWTIQPIFDPHAWKIVLRIIHGRNRDIPRTVTVEQLAGIAAIVDDLECHEAVWFFSQGWLPQPPYASQIFTTQDTARLILIAFVFEQPEMFQYATQRAVVESLPLSFGAGVPIRPIILEHIKEQRDAVVESLLEGLKQIQTQLLEKKLGCNFGCRAMLLGTLIQKMDIRPLRLFSAALPLPLESQSIDTIIRSLREDQPTIYYSPREQSIEGKRLKEWFSSDRYHTAKIPRTLVSHTCGLEEFIDPLLQTAEREAKGLQLVDYQESEHRT